MGTNTDPFYLLTDVNMEVRRHGKKLRHSYRWLCRRMQSERWNEQAGQVEKAAHLVSHPSQPTRRSDIQPEEVTVDVKGRADDETRRLEQLKTVSVFRLYCVCRIAGPRRGVDEPQGHVSYS